MVETAFDIVLLLNVLWFGAGFVYFALRNQKAAGLFVPRALRDHPLHATIAAAIPFLGGMNLALCLFSLSVLLVPGVFAAPLESALIASLFAVAHGSQFVPNVPIALRGGRQGDAYWHVMKGTMLMIFVLDAALALANLLLAILFLMA